MSFAYDKYLSNNPKDGYIPYLYSANRISPFQINDDYFIKETEITKSNFRRPNAVSVFNKEKILLNRFGGHTNAVFSKNNMAFSTYVYCIVLNNNRLNYLITAILNSKYAVIFLIYTAKKD